MILSILDMAFIDACVGKIPTNDYQFLPLNILKHLPAAPGREHLLGDVTALQ
jgi:hypothetical protein